MFSIVNAVMSEATPSFPTNGVFVTIFAIAELKSHRGAVITEPYEKILFMRKKPSPVRLPRHLFDVAYLQKHLKDA